jgi:hypothetical protein
VTAENQEPLVTGYEPVLLPLDRGEDGRHRLQPHNLIASWYWVHGEPARPVPLHLLKQALIDGDGYAPAVVEVLDDDDDGKVDESERVLDTKAKAERIRELIEKQGLDLVRVAGEILPLSLHHGVAGEDWALRDCEACHAPESRTTKAFDLASVIPAGVMPALTPGTDARWAGVLQVTPDGGLQYVPQNTQADVFVAGHDSAGWLDVLGVLLLIGTVLGVAGHTALRIRAARQRRA